MFDSSLEPYLYTGPSPGPTSLSLNSLRHSVPRAAASPPSIALGPSSSHSPPGAASAAPAAASLSPGAASRRCCCYCHLSRPFPGAASTRLRPASWFTVCPRRCGYCSQSPARPPGVAAAVAGGSVTVPGAASRRCSPSLNECSGLHLLAGASAPRPPCTLR